MGVDEPANVTSYEVRLRVAQEGIREAALSVADPPPGFTAAEFRELALACQLLRVVHHKLEGVRRACLERPPPPKPKRVRRGKDAPAR